MAADEKDMLLKVGVDASGVARGVAEVRAGVREMDAAAGAGPAGAAASKEATVALEGQAAATTEAAVATQDLGEQAGISRLEVMNLAATIGGVDPRLAMLIRTAYRARGALQLMFSPTGLAIGGVIAVVGLVSAAIQRMMDRFAEAEARAKMVLAAMRAEQQKEAGRTEEVGDVLGRAGLTSEAAVRSAALLEKQMVGQGFRAEAVRKVLPLAIGKGGERMVSDEELEQMAAMAEFEPEQIAEVKRPGDVERARRTTLGRMRRRPGDVQARLDAVGGRRARLQQAADQKQAWAIRQRLEQAGETLPVGQEDQIIQDIIDLAEGGSISRPGYKASFAAERAAWSEEQGQAARYGELAGVLSPEQVETARKMTLFQKAMRTSRLLTEEGRPGIVTIGQPPAGQKELTWPDVFAGRPATGQPTVINNFHGPTYVGRPGDRFTTRERFPQ